MPGRSRKDLMNTRRIGTFYEEAACRFLEEQGIIILQQNFKCKAGEIDIIGRQGNCVIFFEVKYRKNDTYENALMAVHPKKQQRICRCAAIYCLQHSDTKEIRYDVIGITNTRIQWIKNAFEHKGYCFY